MEPNVDSPGDRLKWARERAGFDSAEAFAKAMSIKPVTYRAYENNQNSYRKHVLEFASRLNVSPGWLLNGGPLPDTEPPEPPAPDAIEAPRELLERLNLVQIRQVNIEYAMGSGLVIDDFAHAGYRTFDREWVNSVVARPADQLFFARGEGDSMQPTMLDGDSVLIDTSEREVRKQDRIWAFAYGDAGMIKRLRRLPSGRFLIISDNETIKPFEAAPDELWIIGRVVWIGRRI